MKNFKKFLTLVLAVMMVVSSFAFSASAATTKFEDVDADNETLVKAVDLLNYMGVAKGKSETNFGADELVTREQFALFIYRLMKGGKDAPANASNTTKFTDLEDSTYFYAISWANASGIVNGKSATTFGPKDPIKLQEAYAMITRALGWEEENDLVYPFGHIEVAEQAGVELDAGLASSVGYADELTRGDMAILLYNAFFAETGKEIVEYKERVLSNGDVALEEYTTRKTLCEDVFDVVEVEYKAVATPNYEFEMVVREEDLANDIDEQKYEGKATYDENDEATVYFQKVFGSDSYGNDAPANVYLTAEQLGMEEAELNDCFLGEFTMFVTLDDDNDIDKVLFADCNMTKKTTSDLKFSEVSSNKTSSYFTESDGEAKLLSGKVVIDGTEEAYFFNAPYTYANEAYGKEKSAFGKYEIRNSKNLEAIKFTVVEEDDEVIYSIEVDEDKAITAVGEADLEDDDFVFEVQGTDLIEAYYNVYYDGLYEADLYDVDGDGLYDYINYKPYMFFQVDADEDKYFEDSNFTADIPYIYTNEATVLGEEFADEDYVVGYFSPELEVVKVAAVVKPTVATVKGYKAATGTITLSTGDKVQAVDAWKLFYNEDAELVWDLEAKTAELVDGNDLFDNKILDADEAEYYVYDGVLLYDTAVDNNVKFTENLIIPTTLNGEKPVKEAPFNPDADNEVYYVYAWVDGVTRYVQVELDDEVTPFVFDDSLELDAAYADKLCTYTVKDNLYTITPLTADVVDVDDAEDVISEALSTEIADLGEGEEEGKADDQIYAEIGDISGITKSGARFNVGFDRYVEFKSYTKIIIKYTDEDDDVEYIELGATDFTKNLNTALTNVVAIVSNNADSTSRENLVLLYAETTDDLDWAGKTSKNDLRIVSNSDVGQDEDGEWRIFYELYDPFTGAKVYDVPSKESYDKAKETNGQDLDEKIFVKLVDGMVDAVPGDAEITIDGEKAEYAISEENLVWISDVDTATSTFKAVAYDSSKTSVKDVEEYVETNEDAFKDIYGRDVEDNYLAYDKNTVVSVLTYGDIDSMWNWGTMTLSDMNAVASAKKELLCYNDKALTGKDEDQYTKRYSEFVKAYVSVDTDVDDDEEPYVEYIIVIVNEDEPTVEHK